ncbi:hypothetical protein AQJ91_14585 [Streptomyces dysideae]|uniref:Uncharacterized protein n=1 Tax=Streptomyces dysideae TaxID=909626 RepID=A0A101V0R3_9ACTN|nr:hypothetical protein AQJ91_14585 [Streptomyces dysideae]
MVPVGAQDGGGVFERPEDRTVTLPGVVSDGSPKTGSAWTMTPVGRMRERESRTSISSSKIVRDLVPTHT